MLVNLQKYSNLSEEDFSNINISSMDISESKFHNIDFSNSDMSNNKMAHVDFEGSSLRNADLKCGIDRCKFV